MSTAILDRIIAAGGTVAVVGGDLRVRAPKGLLFDQERRLLVEHKADLVRLLADDDQDQRLDEHLDQDQDAGGWDQAVEPVPCDQCGSLMLWWDIVGRPHCMTCEAAGHDRSVRLIETAAQLREQIA